MRPLTRIALVALGVALLAALAGCADSGTATGGLVPDERPVPGGMPVMYEFYTTS